VKRILVSHGHALYAKVLIPVVSKLLQSGHQVVYKVNRPSAFGLSYGFSERYIRSNPNQVEVINPQSLRYVAGLIDHTPDWSASQGKLKYHWRGRLGKFDAVISTTKELPRLRKMSAALNAQAFALGYQHIPFMLKVDSAYQSYDDEAEQRSVFSTENSFSRIHSFPEILENSGLFNVGFTYLDKVWDSRNAIDNRSEQDRSVFIFHPGGNRGVFTNPGDSRQVCYANQKKHLADICIPLIEQGFSPILKIHPLRAEYHDFVDVSRILFEIEREHDLEAGQIKCLEPGVWYWEYAMNSEFILTFGSSSIYELWSAGLRNVFVCNFTGRSRSQKFEFFDSIVIDTYDEYLGMIESGDYAGRELNKLGEEVFKVYYNSFDGQSAQSAADLILAEIL